jgi:hypothetical protein
MAVQVIPESLAAADAAVEALTARLASAADAVSLQTATGFSTAGDEHVTVAAQGVGELGRSGAGLGESGISYATGDAAPASSYGI